MSPTMRDLRAVAGTRLILIPAVAAIVGDDAGRVLLVRQVSGTGFRITGDNGDQVEASVFVFVCDLVAGELHCDGVEATEHRRVPPDEVAPKLAVSYPPSLFVDTTSAGPPDR